MALPTLVNGVLPLGRHPATLDEIHERWVRGDEYTRSGTRPGIWEEFLRGTQTLRLAVRVHAMWIGGSFTTDRLDPGDIDVTYLINAADHYSRSEDERRVIEQFNGKTYDASRREFVSKHGLRVDSYILDWAAHTTDLETNTAYQYYSVYRGYWDDWWQRQCTGEKVDPRVPQDAFPSRGYLEVNVDDYA